MSSGGPASARAGPAASPAAGPWLAATGLAVTLVVGMVVVFAGHERADFVGGSFPEVEAAFGAAGLTVCAATEARDPLAAQAVASRTYELGIRCPADVAPVVVDRFADAADRDAAAQRFEALVRPRGSGVVYTLGDTTVFVRGSGDTALQERLDAALRAAGAR
ncbi:MAG: hypothetical protein ACRDRR_10290 [Pseudonocardiaceae bacterium]